MPKKLFLIVLVFSILSIAVWYVYEHGGIKGGEETVHTHHIVVLNPGGETFTIFLDSFMKEIRKIHHEQGLSVVIDYKNTEGSKEKLKTYIDEAIAEKPDLIATISTRPTFDLADKTKTIPILTALGDPTAHGYFKSIQSSGINIAGISHQSIELTPKRIELIKKMIPSIKNIAMFYDTTCGPTAIARPIGKELSKKLGITLTEFSLTNPGRKEIEDAFMGVDWKKFDAIMFYPHGTLFSQSDLFLKVARENKLPIIMPDKAALNGGALASYGPDYADMGRSLARIAEKVLQGEDPGALPFETPSKIDFVLSIKNAKEIGITFSDEIKSIASQIVN